MKTSELEKKVAEREAKIIKYVDFILALFAYLKTDTIIGKDFKVKFGSKIDKNFQKLIFQKLPRSSGVEVKIMYPCPNFFMGLSVSIPHNDNKFDFNNCEVQVYDPVALDGLEWETILNSLIENEGEILKTIEAYYKRNIRRQQACRETALLKAKAKRLGL